MTTPSSILRAIRALLSDPRRWTKATSARDQHGIPTSVLGDDATSFCLSGAFHRATLRSSRASETAGNYLARAIDNGCFSEFNDAPTTTHDHILRALDTAIAIACHQETLP